LELLSCCFAFALVAQRAVEVKGISRDAAAIRDDAREPDRNTRPQYFLRKNNGGFFA
jgi:hypothetical protein